MSYSFSARAATKAEVLAKVDEELDKVVAGQPIHVADRAQARAAAEAFLGVVPDPTSDQDAYVSISGSVSSNADQLVTAASVSVSASVVAKEKT